MFKKKFLKTKCKVTFELPQGIAEGAEDVYLVGDFNNWDEHATQMEKKKGKGFSITVDLEPNKEYQYRYLINGRDWHNDWEADKYVPNPFSGDNSVVTTYSMDGSNGNGHVE
jgi:1,4-alpha-glucan branching enzyme